MAAGANTPTPIGVYRGASPDLAAVQGYEAFLSMPGGVTMDYVLAFMADAPTWPQFETAILQSTTNGPAGDHSAAEWAPLLSGANPGPVLGSRTLMLAVPACVQGTTWADEASGRNDRHWAALASTLVTAGLGNSVLRIAREFSGGWYPWTVNPGNVADHKRGWARIAATMRAAGFTGTMMWNPYIGQGTLAPGSDPSSAYPGNDSVDVIGVDFYDGSYPKQPHTEPRTVAQQQAAWNTLRDSWAGLTGWQSFAARVNRPLAYPEWGLKLWPEGSQYTGGGDNPLLIDRMAGWIKYTKPWMHGFWEDPGMGVSDPDAHPRRIIAAPQARAAFLESFGYG